MTTKKTKKVEEPVPEPAPEFPWESVKTAIYEGEYICWWVEKTTSDPAVLKHTAALRSALEELKKFA